MFYADRQLEIKKVREHYEAYIEGKFVVSGDTISEVLFDLEEMGYIK